MIFEIPFDSVGFNIIVWAGLFFGILHSIIPCNEKFVFCFYAFGVARDWKQAFRIVNFYGAGLMLTSLAIGSSVTYVGASLASWFNIHESFRFVWNAISGGVLILSGAIMLIQLRKDKYRPHSDQFQELTEGLSTLKTKKRTAFLLGILAGIPPCLFEMAIYGYAISTSASYGWGNGTWVVFFFSVGTWVGLYPLALLVSAGGKLSKSLRTGLLQRMRERLSKNSNESAELDASETGSSTTERDGGTLEKKKNGTSRIEYISALLLLAFGVLFFILALFKVDLLPGDFFPTKPPSLFS